MWIGVVWNCVMWGGVAGKRVVWSGLGLMWSGMEVSFVEWRKVKWSCVVLCCVV